jgi:ribonuclease BN (tRNA processing enzyme)
MMELTVLGTGTVAPSPTRTAASYWVATGATHLLLDCGAGTMHRMAAFGVPWTEVTHVALTHFHVDHWGEFPMLLFALRWGVEPARERPLEVIGPVGLQDRLHHAAGAFGEWLVNPGYPLEIRELQPGDAYALDHEVELQTCKTPHTDESMAYSVRDKNCRLVYTGDTGPSDALADWALDCDLLLSECSLPDERSIETHLTPTQAGHLARKARAQRLVLTHFYPPVEEVDPAAVAADVYGGTVIAARDGDRFTIGA